MKKLLKMHSNDDIQLVPSQRHIKLSEFVVGYTVARVLQID